MSNQRAATRAVTTRSPTRRLARRLTVAGVVGVIAAIMVGVVGWILAGRVSDALNTTVRPMASMVTDIADTIEASRVLVDRTTAALGSIEDATRSTARTLESVNGIIEDTASLGGREVADSLESAVDTLPGLVDTARVVDRTMRTLSLLGVDYDPEKPLDESLSDLEESLRPVPAQLRAQVGLLGDVQTELGAITDDSDELAGVLLRARTDMADVGRVLDSASENASQAADGVSGIESELDDFAVLARLLSVLAGVALVAAASAPLMIGRYATVGTRSG